MFLSLSAEDFRRPPRPTGPAHQIIESSQSDALSQLCDLRHRRTAARRQLPPVEDHRQGQLCQSQTGQTRIDRPRGENTASSLDSSAGQTQSRTASAVSHGSVAEEESQISLLKTRCVNMIHEQKTSLVKDFCSRPSLHTAQHTRSLARTVYACIEVDL